MKIIYIAGPYRGRSEWEVIQNIRAAEARALDVWRFGGVALCPHKNTSGFGGARGIDDAVWLKGDMELLRRCDAVWAIEGWINSEGARAEVEFARVNDIPVMFSGSEVARYLVRYLTE
jgi:hypothetical protein